MSDTAALLYRARAVRQQLDATETPAPSADAERLVYITLMTALEDGLHHTLAEALAALERARSEFDSPGERWLRQQLRGFGA